MLHLGRVMTRGYTPTRGEMAWALVDGCFVVADVLSLAALQPGGTVAVEAARTEVKAAGREAVRKAGVELTEDALGVGSKATARTAPRPRGTSRPLVDSEAGGRYLSRDEAVAEALDRMGLAEISRMARRLLRKGRPAARVPGIRYGSCRQRWRSCSSRSPASRGSSTRPPSRSRPASALSAIHKMEEHLASSRRRTGRNGCGRSK